MARGSQIAEPLAFAAASAALAAACAFAIGKLAAVAWAWPAVTAGVSTAVGCAAFIAGRALLHWIAANEPLALPRFELVPVESGAIEPLDELLLTEPWLQAGAHCAGDELLLDDVLQPASSQARVIRLFDPEATAPASAPPDASEALRQALIELRRSLR